MNFTQYLEISELVEKAGAVLVPPTVEYWMADIGKMLPQLDLGLPKIEKSGSIVVLLKRQNPIFIQLDDGTKLFMTLDQFRRIQSQPEIGKHMKVVFQRLADDKSDEPSQLVKAVCT